METEIIEKMSTALMSIRDLKTHFYNKGSTVKAVDDLSLDVKKGEVLGIVGESGSGKTIMALSIMRWVPPPGRIIKGEVILADAGDLMKMSEKELRGIRGKRIAMSFQDPLMFLDPLMKCGEQITEVIRTHQGSTKAEAKRIALEAMNLVRLPNPEVRFKSYPHQMSGGMRQRVLIAIALSCQPDLLILDEPTTALDVITQRDVLETIKMLRSQSDMSIMLITHDLAIVAELCDRVAIMYASKLMELAATRKIFKDSRHPYTKALMSAVPRMDHKKTSIQAIEGNVPDLSSMPLGCVFHPRCSLATEKCRLSPPSMEEVEDGHWSACFRSHEIAGFSERMNRTGD